MELLPAPPRRAPADNPWPQWPMVFRTSSSQEEGGAREFGLLTKRLVGERRRSCEALHAVQVELKREGGAPRLVEVPGTEERSRWTCWCWPWASRGRRRRRWPRSSGVELTRGATCRWTRRFATSADGVFSAGDASRGASLIVWAISDGREAARGRGRVPAQAASRLPTRGAHVPFGGR